MPITSSARRLEQGAEVHAHHVVGEALRHHEQAAVELFGVHGVDAVGRGDQGPDLALEEVLPIRPAPVAVPVQARRDAAHAAQRLLQHRHVAPDAPEPLAQQAEGAPAFVPVVQAQDLADLPERGGVDAVREQPGVAVGAAVVGVTVGDGAQELRRRAVAAGHRVGARGEEAAVVV
jgi:hypothetical protein